MSPAVRFTRDGDDFWTLTDEESGRQLGIYWYHLRGAEESFNVMGSDYEVTKHPSLEAAVAAARAWLEAKRREGA